MSDQTETTTAEVPAEAAQAAPTAQKQRFLALDATRGWALFGVLLVNILSAAQPIAYIFMPWNITDDPVHLESWAAISVFFAHAARGMFGLMFGAGMVLILDRLSERHGDLPARKIYLRRLVILFLFGLVDMFVFLWWGDILFLYALCGMVIFLFRESKAWKIWLAAGIFGLIAVAMGTMNGFMYKALPQYEAALAKVEAGEELTEEEVAMKSQFDMFYSKEANEAEVELLSKGSFGEVYSFMVDRAFAFNFNLMSILLFSIWDSMLMMAIGILMYRKGWLTGQGSTRAMVTLSVLGLGLGFGIRWWVVNGLITSDYDTTWQVLNGALLQPGRVLVAIGFVGLIQLLVRVPWMSFFSKPLAAVGQMAFTTYLTQSILYAAMYYGFSGGLYGQIKGFDLWYLAAGIFVIQAIVAMVWLKYYRFGPFEWAWRSLTYKKAMPMRR